LELIIKRFQLLDVKVVEKVSSVGTLLNQIFGTNFLVMNA